MEVWIGDGWQRLTLLDGKEKFWRPPLEGDTDDNLLRALETFLNDHPKAFWLETTDEPHGVYFGSGAPRLFRLTPAS
ncbi:hypothetical protein [Streptomyces cyaneofuscatus]|uniref:hypothetical protein n=1 Tax=Streptomyces cyaneofuscatus TaxID=66883 RepID=UPI003330050C